MDWEQAKENFQPLKRGREAEALVATQTGDEEVAARRRWVLGAMHAHLQPCSCPLPQSPRLCARDSTYQPLSAQCVLAGD